MAGRKSKYSSKNSNDISTKIWTVAEYIRLSQEDNDTGIDKQVRSTSTIRFYKNKYFKKEKRVYEKFR